MVYPQQSLMTTLINLGLFFSCVHGVGLPAKSGILPWVDVHTSKDVYSITSSRGDTWNLVFSDEFEVAGRDFSPGNDYLWTALELPDGVNAALEYYSFNTTSTTTEPDGRGVFQIEVRQEPNISFTVYNTYKQPNPGYDNYVMYYRAGMVQSWNKFCFQGGLVDLSVQLPGAVSSQSGNPDLGNPKSRVKNNEYYPTWPGIWLMGNLGRALFTGSTSRMWPWSYNECDPNMDKNQRISACNDNPGFGLNKGQGRGAPEIDVLEGGGIAVSTSIQVAPGMPQQFRMFPPDNDTNSACYYGGGCSTTGANYPGIPTAYYQKRGYKSWYQGLRYGSNTFCTPDGSSKQDPSVVISNLKRGITDNQCKGINTCPASKDGNSDVTLIDGKGPGYWGVNAAGGCMPEINGYQGSYLCDPYNTNSRCSPPLRDGNPDSSKLASFNYQMDALSANSGLPLQAYTGYLNYQLEWVMGEEGYIRWMIEGIPIYEIPAKALTDPPQDDNQSNPKKLMIEEPMYLIFNVALSTSWGARPPNPGKPCQGDGKDEKVNRICNDFPLYMKIDYIRIYQDTSDGSKMAIGCDPASHPTKKWIEGHIEQYQDGINKLIDVVGGAPCFSDDDCTVDSVAVTDIVTGRCSKAKCSCLQGSWGGPRCTTAANEIGNGPSQGYGPSVEVALSFGGMACLILCVVVYKIIQKRIQTRLEHAFIQKTTQVEEIPMQEVVRPQPL